MLHKAFLVLFIFVLGLAVEVNGIIDYKPSTTDLAFLRSVNDNDVFCPETRFESDHHGTFIFPRTRVFVKGVQVKVDCPFGFRNDGMESFSGGKQETKENKDALSGAIRKCNLVTKEDQNVSVGEWEPENTITIDYCKEEGWEELVTKWQITVDNMTPLMINGIDAQINELIMYAVVDHDCAMALINGIDSILRNPSLGPGTVSQKDRNAVLGYVDTLLEKISDITPPGFKTKVGSGGIIVETAKFHGMAYYFLAARSTGKSYVDFGIRPYVTTFTALENMTVDVDISAEALYMSMEEHESTNPQLKITAYSEDVLKAWNEPGTTSELGLYVTDNEFKNAYKSWGLLSIDLNGMIVNLTDPIQFVITNSELSVNDTMKCVYWDQKEKKWSNEGLESIPVQNGVRCKSTHLTAFSALIEPLPLPFPGAEYAPINNSIHSHILSILSSIGSVCSIVGLSLTLLTYGLFRSLRRERSNRILINLSTSLLLLHIMSVSGSKDLWDGHCFVPAASMHYLVLTSLAWMMVEAIHMFELLISVFVRPETRFLIKRLVLAWGIPLIVVGVCTAVQPQVYKVGRADLCLMSAHENIVMYYVAYIGPICIMLLVNTIIFGRIFRVLYQQTKRTKGTANGMGMKQKYQFVKISPSQIKGAVSVLVLLGIGWVLGLLAMGPFEVIFRYMYCICNAGQGLFIFIFRVLLNPHANKQWRTVILGISSDNSLDTSFSSTTISGSARGRKRKSTMIFPNFISAANSVENSLTASNPLSATLATTLASILRSEDARAAAVVD